VLVQPAKANTQDSREKSISLSGRNTLEYESIPSMVMPFDVAELKLSSTWFRAFDLLY
jgi:hypothetical protein